MDTHPTRQIPLSDLRSTEESVRVTPSMEDAHDELVASIKAHGLLQDIVVRASGTGNYNVVAGNRRLAALLAIVQSGEMSPDAPIHCTVLANGIDDWEASLAENTVRVAMHPADQAAAFRKLADAGATPEDIANRFGLSSRTVEQRLRLGHLAPPILDAYRAGEIGRDVAHAYATTDDTETQEDTFKRIGSNQYAANVLNLLQKDRMRSDSDIARFVGAKPYAAAGGMSESTLFEDYAMLTDVGLLDRLAMEKMERSAARVKGWKWVETMIEGSVWQVRDACTQIYPTPGTPTPEEQEILDDADEWDTAHGEMEWEDLSPEAQAEGNRLRGLFDPIQVAVANRREFTPEQMAASGVMLFIEQGGKTGKVEGLVRKGDPVPGRDDMGSTNNTREAAKAKPKGYPQGVQESITELRNGVLRAMLCSNPEVARDALMFNLIMSMKSGYDPGQDGGSYYPQLPMTITHERALRQPITGATFAMKTFLDDPKLDLPWCDQSLPLGVLFERYRGLDLDTKNDLTALVAASAMKSLPGGELTDYNVHDAIEVELEPAYGIELLEVDADVWSAETLWGRLRKDQIIDEAKACLGDEWATEAAKMKKGELAADATAKMKAHGGWLPRGFYAAERPEPKKEDDSDAR